MANLTRAHHELFHRSVDERFSSLEDLLQHCQQEKQFSNDCWHLPQTLQPRADDDAVTVTLGEEGIHVRPSFLFQWRHPPILIPWKAVTKVEQKGLAIFPMADTWIDSGDSGRPFKITFYGRRLVGGIVHRHATGSF